MVQLPSVINRYLYLLLHFHDFYCDMSVSRLGSHISECKRRRLTCSVECDECWVLAELVLRDALVLGVVVVRDVEDE